MLYIRNNKSYIILWYSRSSDLGTGPRNRNPATNTEYVLRSSYPSNIASYPPEAVRHDIDRYPFYRRVCHPSSKLIEYAKLNPDSYCFRSQLINHYISSGCWHIALPFSPSPCHSSQRIAFHSRLQWGAERFTSGFPGHRTKPISVRAFARLHQKLINTDEAGLTYFEQYIPERAGHLLQQVFSFFSSSRCITNMMYYSIDSKCYRILANIISSCSFLEIFICNGNPLEPLDVQSLAYSIKQHPSLCNISLSGCNINDETFFYLNSVFKSQRNLTHLDISMNDISADGMSILSKALKMGGGQSIQHLDLSYNPIGELGTRSLNELNEISDKVKDFMPSLMQLLMDTYLSWESWKFVRCPLLFDIAEISLLFAMLLGWSGSQFFRKFVQGFDQVAHNWEYRYKWKFFFAWKKEEEDTRLSKALGPVTKGRHGISK